MLTYGILSHRLILYPQNSTLFIEKPAGDGYWKERSVGMPLIGLTTKGLFLALITCQYRWAGILIYWSHRDHDWPKVVQELCTASTRRWCHCHLSSPLVRMHWPKQVTWPFLTARGQGSVFSCLRKWENWEVVSNFLQLVSNIFILKSVRVYNTFNTIDSVLNGLICLISCQLLFS